MIFYFAYRWTCKIIRLSISVGEWNEPARIQFAPRGVTIRNVSHLGNWGWVWIVIALNINHGVANLKCPRIHNILDADWFHKWFIFVSKFGQRCPQIILNCVGVCVFLQILRDSVTESVFTQELVHHSNYYWSFRVADCIKDLRNLVWVANCNRDWMWRFHSVDLENIQSIIDRLLVKWLPFGMKIRNSQASHVCCKT